ncbi:MAG: nucleoside monophosphate kinase [candidate division SR1 bacterium]|nr:nucleoside monophosphate kinase [candidate division SR1 bacterium]
MKDLIFLGVQGCGKGTQGKLLLKDYPNTVYMEMGQLCRALMSNDNGIGNYIRNIVNNGIMVDNFITHDLLHTTVQIANKEGKGIMMDGFPRLMEQAEYMIKTMEEYKRDYVIVHFELSKEKALERMQKRAAIEARVDDTPEAMERRLAVFYNETLPVIKHFEDLGKAITVNADASIEEVQAELKSKLGL